MRPGAIGWATDVCVPMSRLAKCIEETKMELKASTVPATILGHVGDGNFHAWALYNLQDPASLKKAEKVNDDLVRYAISVGGTASGTSQSYLGGVRSSWLFIATSQVMAWPV